MTPEPPHAAFHGAHSQEAGTGAELGLTPRPLNQETGYPNGSLTG